VGQIIQSVWQGITQWIAAHPGWATLFTYHALSAFVGSLEMPTTQSSAFYRFFFKFVNALAANYARAQASTTSAGYQPPKPETVPGPQVPVPPKVDKGV
jgi:hypothetical protein